MIGCWRARFPNSANFSTRKVRHFSSESMPGCWRTKQQGVQVRRRRLFASAPAGITFKTDLAKTESMRGATTVTRTLRLIGAIAAMLLVSCDGVDVAGIQGSGGP